MLSGSRPESMLGSFSEFDAKSSAVSSLYASPHMQSTKPPFPEQQQSVSQWFQRIIFFRIAVAVAFHAFYCFLVYFIGACILQFSLWHPVQAVLDCVSLFMSYRSIGYGLLFAFLGAVSAAILGLFVLQFDAEDRLTCKSPRAWLIYFGALNVALAQVICLALGSDVPELSRYFMYLVIITFVVATFLDIFRSNNRLMFPIIEAQPHMQFDYIVLPAAGDVWYKKLPKVLKWSAIYAAAFGFPTFGLSLFRNLLGISIYFDVFVLLVIQLFLHQLATRLIKMLVLQKYEFSMPPPYVVLNPTPEQQRTLMDALRADGITKAYAFWDLRTLSTACHRRRQVIFSLSQPGGHPRNWDAIRLACLEEIQWVNSQFENENERIRAETFASVTAPVLPPSYISPERERPAILLQTPWQKGALRQRLITGDPKKGVAASNVTNRLPSLIEKIKSLISSDRQIVAPFTAYIAMLAIESLSALICASFNEDHFGVVQKDLGLVVSALLQCCNNLQKYMRTAKEDKKLQHRTCQPLLASVTMALNRIRVTFPEGSISKRLSLQDGAYFERLTSLD